MTEEQQFFIQILADHIHGRPSAPRTDTLDWEKLAEYADEQALPGLAYIQTRDFFREHPDTAPDIAERLHKRFRSEVYLYVNRDTELKEIARQCGDMPLVLIKGSVVQHDYPEPVLRSMGDVDFVIHTEDRQKADAIMLAEGYSKMVDNHAVWTYDKDHIEFEIHDHMFYEYLTNNVDYQGYFDQVWDHVQLLDGTKNIYVPEKNFHFLYVMAHTAKHIVNKGMGFRAFLDMVFMVRQEPALDWDWLAAELERLELLDFTRTCFALCQRWFGVTMPLASGVPEESFFEEVTDKAFRDGTFGLHNEQNEAAHSAKELSRAEAPYWRAALALAWRKLFPPYKDMQLVPWYRFVDGRPWLLPAAWVYRWFYTARHKFSQSKAILTEPFAKRNQIEARKTLIDRWGL